MDTLCNLLEEDLEEAQKKLQDIINMLQGKHKTAIVNITQAMAAYDSDKAVDEAKVLKKLLSHQS